MTGQNVIYSIGMTLDDLEKLVIQKAMFHFRGNKMTTAASLGIDRRTLDHRLDKYANEQKKEEERKYRAGEQRAEALARARGNPPNNIGMPYNAYDSARNSNPRMGAESSFDFAEKQQMPLPKRNEVQEMLSNETPKSSKKK